MMLTTRRTLIAGAAAATATMAQNPEPKVPQLSADLVRDFVGNAHSDLDAVRNLAKKEPRLVYASQDWGAGDFETGLNAASHMGRRDIADFLLESGARPDAPAVVMLGLTPIVKGMLAAFPDLHKTPGAHGIPLLTHAVVGKAQAVDTLHLLLAAGADVNGAAWRGGTALIQAVAMEQIDTVRLLLDRGADRSLKNMGGMTALDVAKKRNYTAIAALLEKS